MRLLNRLLVFLFVRRKAQSHARAVLDAKVQKRSAAVAPKPAEVAAALQSASAVPVGLPLPAPGSTDNSDPAPAVATAAQATAREDLIRSALAARKSREAEWEALPPEVKSRAIVGLGDGMEAIVKTFRRT